MLGSMVSLLGMLVDFKLFGGIEQPKWLRASAGNPLWNTYECKDDKWLVLSLLQSDRYWPSICRVLGLEHLEKDPRFEDFAVRSKNSTELVSILDKVFATKTRSEWLDILGKSGDLLFEPVNTISDVVEDPQVQINNYITEYQHPSYGKVSAVGFPMHFSQAETSVRLPPPEFGQHTEEVLQDILGYSWDEITELKAEKVI
jgi:formyl-CoA transferase